MSAQRYAHRTVSTCLKSDPEVIDVSRDAIDFRGEGNRDAGRMDEIAMVEWQVAMPGTLAMSVWQAI